MKKIYFGIFLYTLIFSSFNLYAEDSDAMNSLYLIYGFGNFGPNHQLSGESASYKEIQIKYSTLYSSISKYCIGGGLIFNREFGNRYAANNIYRQYDVTSKLFYLLLEFDISSDYYGFHFGALYLNRERGYYDEGPEQFFRPSVGIRLGLMNKIYIFGEIVNDLIYTSFSEKMPFLVGITIKANSIIETITVGVFNLDLFPGIDLKLDVSITNRIIGTGQAVIQSEDNANGFRIGIGYKI